jgi:hypothetical protein
MRKFISFSLFNDWIEGGGGPQLILNSSQALPLKPPYISFDLLLEDGQIVKLSGLFHFDTPIPFSINSETFLDIVYNLKGRQAWIVRDGRTEVDENMILDLESTVNQIFNEQGTEVLRLICAYYLILWVLQEHPFAYDLDLPLPHVLEKGNYFNRNGFKYFRDHLDLAYHLPYLPICMIALAGKALELINIMYLRVEDGPILPTPSIYQTGFRLLKYYAQVIQPSKEFSSHDLGVKAAESQNEHQKEISQLTEQLTLLKTEVAELSKSLIQIPESKLTHRPELLRPEPVKVPQTITLRKAGGQNLDEVNVSNPTLIAEIEAPKPPGTGGVSSRVGGALDLLFGDS